MFTASVLGERVAFLDYAIVGLSSAQHRLGHENETTWLLR